MLVTGYQIREAIKRWILQRDVVSKQFGETLYTFEGEQNGDPTQVMNAYDEADQNEARLEEIQQVYNQTVICPVGEDKITLSLAVKLVGGAGRREKMWREAATGKRERYSYGGNERERDKTKEYAKRLITVDECVANAQAAAKHASALRNAIARANSTEIETKKLGLSDEEAQQLFG